VLAAAPELARLVAACRRLAILVTSRAPLRVAGERELPVRPLAVPDAGVTTRERAGEYASVRLFVERVQAITPAFALDERNALEVAAICRQLDGLPLALELAAARARLLPLPALLARLNARLALLTDAPRDADDRHRTLRAAIDWSYDLLGPSERAHFRRLSVFAGGATLEAIGAVGGSPAVDLDDLAALVEGSLLVQQEEPDGEPRFTMLETVREYALERLEAEDDAAAALRRHAERFLALVEQAAEHGSTAQRSAWLARLDREQANLRAALAWWLREGDAERALRFGAAAWSFWVLRGQVVEGRQALTRVLALPGADAPTQSRAVCLMGAGRLALNQGDTGEAERCYEASLAVARQIGDADLVIRALLGLGRLAMERRDLPTARARFRDAEARARREGLMFQVDLVRLLGLVALEEGDYAPARAYFEQVLTHARERDFQHGIAMGLSGLGHVAHAEGDPVRARELYEQGLAAQRQFGDRRAIALVLANLGLVAVDLADRAAARGRLTEALTIGRQLGDRSATALALEGFAGLAAAEADPARAALLERAARDLRERGGAPRPRAVGDWLARWLEDRAAPPGDAAVPSLEEAIVLALG
jgi:predicted ATPase